MLDKFLSRIITYHWITTNENALWRNLGPIDCISSTINDKHAPMQLYLDKIKSLKEEELQKEAEKTAQDTLRRNCDNVNFFINMIAGAIALNTS